jgi:hypothetical protein
MSNWDDEKKVVELLHDGHDIHVCDGNKRSASIGPVGEKFNFDPVILDRLYKANALIWHGAVNTKEGMISKFTLKKEKDV